MMKRDQEWNTLLQQAENVPDGLEACIQQAVERGQRSERRKKFWKPVTAVLGTAAAFVLLVNCSVDFALAASRVPIVRELVEAVVLDPSLKAAIAHEYVQLVGETYTKDGVTLKIEYLVADIKNLTVFYRVYDEKGRDIALDPELKNETGEGIASGASFGQEWIGQQDEETGLLGKLKALFRGGKPEHPIYYWKFMIEENTPERVRVDIKAYQAAGMAKLPLGITFEVPLTIEPQFLRSVKTFDIHETVSVLGQTLTIDTVEVYPTNTCVKWHTAPDNDSWLTYLPFYLTDANGVRVDGIMNGVAGSGGDPNDGVGEIYLESAWYDIAETLTLHLDDAAALPKDLPPAILHGDGTLTGLPSYMKQDFSEESSESFYDFSVLTEKGTYHSNTDPFRGFVDANGKQSGFSKMYSRMLEEDHLMHTGYLMPTDVTYPLELEIAFAPAQKLPQPISVSVR